MIDTQNAVNRDTIALLNGGAGYMEVAGALINQAYDLLLREVGYVGACSAACKALGQLVDGGLGREMQLKGNLKQ